MQDVVVGGKGLHIFLLVFICFYSLVIRAGRSVGGGIGGRGSRIYQPGGSYDGTDPSQSGDGSGIN